MQLIGVRKQKHHSSGLSSNNKEIPTKPLGIVQVVRVVCTVVVIKLGEEHGYVYQIQNIR